MRPVTQAMAARIGDYPRIALDVGCGSGSMEMPPRWRVYGVDPAATMLSPGRTVQGKASSLPIEDAAVDAVVSRFALSLEVDLDQALAETHRVLRLGGTLTVATWGAREENLWASVPERILSERLAIRLPSDDEPSAYRLEHPEETRARLAAAGFSRLTVESVQVPYFDRMDGVSCFDAVAKLIGPIRTMMDRLHEDDQALARTEIGTMLDGVSRVGNAWVHHGVREAQGE